MPQVRARRVYDQPEASDGTRVLVDRLWPRGLAKGAAHIDEWLKAVAPPGTSSTARQRTWPNGFAATAVARGLPVAAQDDDYDGIPGLGYDGE